MALLHKLILKAKTSEMSLMIAEYPKIQNEQNNDAILKVETHIENDSHQSVLAWIYNSVSEIASYCLSGKVTSLFNQT